MYDLIIIGGGPAGISAGVYASRKQLSTLLITKEWGGQSTVSPDIQNWIGTISISGNELAKSLEDHLKAYAGEFVTILDNNLVKNISKSDSGFRVTLNDGSTHESRSVLVATGSVRRKLTVPGAETFDQKGLTYCATCDGPMFSGQDVVVIGGGNAGFETAAQLLAYTKSVTLLHHGDAYKADPVTVEKVLSHPNMTGILNAKTKEILGDTFVSGVVYEDTAGEDHILSATGVFVEIGLVPSTDYVADLVELDDYKRIKIDPWTQQTNVPGIWAAGDCTNIKYHQNNISAGDAVRALEDIYVHLKTK
ncbi:MAG: FAD-dependent oxidoreductase [Candidatus Pacebacteria bacterium]|nr:FAD-dependent oxidoreductase [Candidatus Paceibacterota bacterium]MCF7857602.1 FAD-dependent oxidoreductase [Candidatus Paceibacterota bacterium]